MSMRRIRRIIRGEQKLKARHKIGLVAIIMEGLLYVAFFLEKGTFPSSF